MILIDTSYLIALLRSRDALHERARKWTHVLTDQTLVTEYVLVETAASLAPPSERKRTELFIRDLIDRSQTLVVWSSERMFRNALQMYSERVDKHWSLADCASFVVMQQYGIHQALTYDAHFVQAGFDALLRRDPT